MRLSVSQILFAMPGTCSATIVGQVLLAISKAISRAMTPAAIPEVFSFMTSTNAEVESDLTRSVAV